MSLLSRLFKFTLLMSAQTSVVHASNAKDSTVTNCEFNTSLDQWVCQSQDASLKQVISLDWISKDFLSPDQKNQLPPGCSGAYIDPMSDISDDNTVMANLPLIVESDNAEVMGVNFAKLSGDVKVSQGPRSIAAEEMSYNRLTDEAELKHKVSIRQPGILIQGERAKVSTTQQQGRFDNAEVIFHDMHMRGSAEAIEQNGRDRITLRGGTITSCEPSSKAWSLEGAELGIDRENGHGYGKNVKLKIGRVPVFYLPYINFPIGDERRSGFLFPSISSSDDGGLDISVPYYLNLAENYDMTLSPRLITGRGAMLETEFRHLNKRFLSQLNAAYLNQDSGGNDKDVDELIANNEAEEESLRPHKGSDRWLVQFQQRGGQRSGWYSNIHYTKTSDEDYFRDLGTSSFAVANKTYLNQTLEIGRLTEHWHLNARLQDYQTLLLDLESPYRKLPELNADAVYNFDDFSIHIDNQLTRFDHRDQQRLDGSPFITGTRLATDYRFARSFADQGAYAKPEFGYKVLSYRLDTGEGDELNKKSINLSAAQASLDLGLVFENRGGQYLQTLEPRVFYLFREFEDHRELYNATASGQTVNFDSSARTFSYGQLYRDSRFSGSDRLDDANQVTIGLTNRWVSQVDAHEYFNVSLGQIKHFRDRRIGLESEVTEDKKTSEWALEFAYNWRDGSGLYGGLIYDTAAEQMDRFSTGYNFASKDQLSLYSIGYSFVRANPELSEAERVDQLDGAFVSPINPQWYLMGRANFDFENGQELETFLGFEYNDCCYRFRLLFRRWLDSNIARIVEDEDAIIDQGIFFELHLKGLGGSGAKINTILEDAIPGYRRREERLNTH